MLKFRLADMCSLYAVQASQVQHPWRNLLKRKYRPQFIITLLIPFFQQFTGINSIIFYAPQLFSSLGYASRWLQYTQHMPSPCAVADLHQSSGKSVLLTWVV